MIYNAFFSSSSPSSRTSRWKYDVFLSFRGDMRKKFADHLYDALIRRGIKTFRDENNLDKGKAIAAEIFEAIEQSRSSIVLLSKNYANSSWCLDEVVKIHECMNNMGQIVFPVFYGVDPCDVDEQTGKFGEAFAKLEQRFGKSHEKVKQWRIALKEVANIAGWDLQDRHESKFIQEIVEGIFIRLKSSFSRSTALHLVASAESSVKVSEIEQNGNRYHKVAAQLEQALTRACYETLGMSDELKQRSTIFCYCSYGDAEYKSCTFLLSAHITKLPVPVPAVATFRQRIKKLIRIVVGGQPTRNIEEEILVNIQEDIQVNSQDCPMIPLDILSEATLHFSNQSKLGKGGYGPVYKGTLKDGIEVAVKMLSKPSLWGRQQFINEINVIAKLRHRNIVRILGYCLEKMLVVYEYMPNRSLDFFLSDSNMSKLLDWKRRLAIINGVAQGLLYLHEDSSLRIVHRDLKPGNILLDYDMNPKISDFGLAMVLGHNFSMVVDHAVGTIGYVAPEYLGQLLVSTSLDVYSFGIVLMEIISGKRIFAFCELKEPIRLISFARELWSQGEGLKFMDASLLESSVAAEPEVLKCIQIALLCVQEDPTYRPNMSSVVKMLASDTITDIKLLQPTHRSLEVERKPNTNWIVNSVNDVTLSDVVAR